MNAERREYLKYDDLFESLETYELFECRVIGKDLTTVDRNKLKEAVHRWNYGRYRQILTTKFRTVNYKNLILALRVE